MIVPVSLVLILFLLYTTFNSLKNALLVLVTLPFALIGGIFSLVLTGTNFSISAAVGVISTLGVAILGGVLLISRIEDFRRGGLELQEAILKGADVQMRPILMATWPLPLLAPAALATGIGSQAQKPLARVVVGGCSRRQCGFSSSFRCCMKWSIVEASERPVNAEREPTDPQ